MEQLHCIAFNFEILNIGYKSGIKALPVIGPNEGLQLLAIVDHVDGDEERKTGDFWQLEGPLTYKPTPYAVCEKCYHLIRPFNKSVLSVLAFE